MMHDLSEIKKAADFVEAQCWKEIESLEKQLEEAKHKCNAARALGCYATNVKNGVEKYVEDKLFEMCENAEIEFD